MVANFTNWSRAELLAMTLEELTEWNKAIDDATQ